MTTDEDTFKEMARLLYGIDLDPIRPPETDEEPWFPTDQPDASVGAWLTGALLVAAALVAVLVVRRMR